MSNAIFFHFFLSRQVQKLINWEHAANCQIKIKQQQQEQQQRWPSPMLVSSQQHWLSGSESPTFSTSAFYSTAATDNSSTTYLCFPSFQLLLCLFSLCLTTRRVWLLIGFPKKMYLRYVTQCRYSSLGHRQTSTTFMVVYFAFYNPAVAFAVG